MSTTAKSDHVDIRHNNKSPYSIPYGQHYCPICYGQIDTGFRCIKCGRQFSPPKNNSSVTAKDGWED